MSKMENKTREKERKKEKNRLAIFLISPTAFSTHLSVTQKWGVRWGLHSKVKKNGSVQ